MKTSLELKDISNADGQMTTVEMADLMDVPLDVAKMPWKPLTEEQREKYCCMLDDLVVLQIPRPKTVAEEEALVNKFLDGMRKLFSDQDNWTFLSILETSTNYCAKCNSCSRFIQYTASK